MINGLHECSCLDNPSFHSIYDDRPLEDSAAAWEGSCIGSRNESDEPDDLTLPFSGLTSDERSEVECAGYRSEEWFGGDGLWRACDGTTVKDRLALMLSS